MKASSRLLFLIAVALPYFPASLARGAASPVAPRPNIPWLIAEDFGLHLGCYGPMEVSTPNLDWLAAEGVRYTRFFTM